MNHQHPQHTITASVETVKPAVAEEWLALNTANRPIRDRIVAAYARDMAAGNWRLSGEAIKFAKSGPLLDGQHRLRAIVQADVAVPMLIIRGLEDDTQMVMDSGTARTAGDALKLRGDGDYSALSAAARLAHIYETDRLLNTSSKKITHTEILEFIDAHPDLRQAVSLAATWLTYIDMPKSVLSLAIWRLMRVDPDACVLFFSKLADKTNLSARDPILALINRLTEIRRNGRRVNREDYLSLVFRAWNYWRRHQLVTALPVRVNSGSVDIPEPR